MKTRIIKIDNIADIDLSRVSVYDMGNRYIDSGGNMYGLKFNRQKKKIDIIKIIRTSIKSADQVRHRMMAYKKSMASGKNAFGNDIDGFDDETADLDDVLGIGASASGKKHPKKDNPATQDKDDTVAAKFNPDQFINKTIELMKSHKDRLQGVMMNVKNSRVVSEKDKNDSHYLLDIFRNIDIDGSQRIEKILTLHKELVSYPRSLSYYVAKLDTRSKNIVDNIGDDTEKMRFIYLTEMFFAIKNLYKTIQRIMGEFDEFLADKNPEEKRNFSYNEIQFFHDAKTSIENTISETEEILDGCNSFQNHLFVEKSI